MPRSRRGVSAPEETPQHATSARRRGGEPSGRRGSARSRMEEEEPSSNRFERSAGRARPSRGASKEDDSHLIDDTLDGEVVEMQAGWNVIAERKAKNDALDEERKNRLSDFFLMEDEEAEIQLINDEPISVEGHMVRNRYGRMVFEPCQKHTQKHCLMCQDGIKTQWRAAVKILDFRGEYDKDKKAFKWDKPVEKLWLLNMTLAAQLSGFLSKKSHKKPSEISILISRSGSGKATSYNIQPLLGDDDRPVPPTLGYKETKATLRQALQPKSDDALEAMGFSAGDY